MKNLFYKKFSLSMELMRLMMRILAIVFILYMVKIGYVPEWVLILSPIMYVLYGD